VLLGRLFGNKQNEKKRNRLSVRRIKRNGSGESQESAAGVFQPLDPTVGYGDALTEAGRAQLLTGKQAVKHCAARDSLIVLKQQAGVFEDTLLAAGIEIKNDIVGAEELSDLVHTETQTMAAITTGNNIKESREPGVGKMADRPKPDPPISPSLRSDLGDLLATVVILDFLLVLLNLALKLINQAI